MSGDSRETAARAESGADAGESPRAIRLGLSRRYRDGRRAAAAAKCARSRCGRADFSARSRPIVRPGGSRGEAEGSLGVSDRQTCARSRGYRPGRYGLCPRSPTATAIASTLFPASRTGRRPTWASRSVTPRRSWTMRATPGFSAFDGGLIKVDAQGKTQKPGRYFRSRQKFDSAAVRTGGVLYAAAKAGLRVRHSVGGRQGSEPLEPRRRPRFRRLVHQLCPGHDRRRHPGSARPQRNAIGLQRRRQFDLEDAIPREMLGSPVLDRDRHIYVGASHFPRGKRPRGLWCAWTATATRFAGILRRRGRRFTPVIGDDDEIYFGDNTGTIHHETCWATASGWWKSARRSVPPAHPAPYVPRLWPGRRDVGRIAMSSARRRQDGWPKIGRTLGRGTR